MTRINSKMKLLSLALLGLGGFAFAGAAAAACPTSPVPPWSGTFVGGGSSAIQIVDNGYDGTDCRLQSTLGNNGTARAAVIDDTPSDETSYRAQFIFDPAALAGTNGTEQAVVFLANAGAAYNGSLNMVRISYSGKGGGGKRLVFTVYCDNGSSNTCNSLPVDLPVQNGPNRIEFQLVSGASGTAAFRYWVSDLATATSDSSPTGSVAVTGGNAGWVGVNKAQLGLTAPSTTYRTLNADQPAYFDQFDSRRNTFIGKP